MIIIAYIPGQLGNMLFLYSNFIAYSIEYNIKVKNPSFYLYTGYFKNMKTGTISAFSLSNKKNNILKFTKLNYKFWYYTGRTIYKLNINNKFIKSIYINWDESFDLVENKHLLNAKHIIAQGWLFSAKKLLKNHKQKIVNYFEPREIHKNNVTDFLNSINKTFVKVGVHIRHGDYEKFENGKYFYTINEYKKFLHQIVNLFADKKVYFIICSNTKLNKADFEGFNFSFGLNHEFEDMLTLSQCDYITGPPSTYSMWASFYGDTPLLMLKNNKQKLSLSSFKIYE